MRGRSRWARWLRRLLIPRRLKRGYGVYYIGSGSWNIFEQIRRRMQ